MLMNCKQHSQALDIDCKFSGSNESTCFDFVTSAGSCLGELCQYNLI